jgi:hypothetical protein
MMLPLPKTVGEGTPRIILGLPGDLDPNVYPIDEVFKVMFMCGDLMMEDDDQMIVAGQVNIVDLKKASLAHFLHFTPTMMKKMTTLMEQGSPFRLKAIHYVNVPPFFEKFFNLIRSFLNEKMRARVSKNLNLNPNINFKITVTHSWRRYDVTSRDYPKVSTAN